MKYTEERQYLFNGNECINETIQTPIIRNTDIVVAGGGFAGITAAVSAARSGSKVILLEKYGCLGGLASLGMVNYVTPYKDWYEHIVGGIGYEIVEKLKILGAKEAEYDVTEEHPWLSDKLNWKTDLFGEVVGKKRYGVQFDSEKLKIVADELLLNENVEIFYHAAVVAATTKEGHVETIIAETKGGRIAINAKAFIDCTGEGDLAAVAGAEFLKGRAKDGKLLPVTTMIRIRGVDVKQAMAYQKVCRDQYGYADILIKARAEGKIDIPHTYILVRPTVYGDGLEINGTRVTDIDGTNIYDITKAEIVIRKQAEALESFFREYVPGCKNAYTAEIAPMLGIRETRRILGEYVIQDEDLPNASKFYDSVGRGTIHVDIHNPEGGGYDIRPVKAGDWYEIPYRSLIAKGFTNLFMAGRCVSSTSIAQSGLRLYLNVFVSGQGAGTAASLCVRGGVAARDLDVGLLQKTLTDAKVKLVSTK